MINIQRFGAVGDGRTDDTAAFIAGIAELENDRDSLYIPAGKYILTRRLSIGKGDITIRGDGAASTKLIWSDKAISLGVSIDVSKVSDTFLEQGSRFNVSGLSFITNKLRTGTGMYISGSHKLGTIDVGNRLSDLVFAGGTDNANWAENIDIDECGQVSITDVKIDGRGINGSSSYGIRIAAQNNSTQYFLNGCNITWVNNAIQLDSSGNYGPEGVHVSNCDLVAVQYGVNGNGLAKTTGANGLQVTNCHTAAERASIRGHFTQCVISGNLFYDRPSTPNGSAHVFLTGNGTAKTTQQCIVHNNQFVNAYSSKKHGVVFGDNAGYTLGSVKNNMFIMTAGCHAIHIKSDSDNIFTSGNIVNGGAKSVADFSGKNAIGGRFTLAYLSSSQAIGHSTDHAVVWNGKGADPDALIIAGNSEIIMPAGVSRIRIRACVSFSGNSSGERSVVIQRDSGRGYTGNWIGRGGGKIPGGVGLAVQVNAQTPVINVAQGYKFRVIAGQTSGSTLSLQDNRTWVEIEVIE